MFSITINKDFASVHSTDNKIEPEYIPESNGVYRLNLEPFIKADIPTYDFKTENFFGDIFAELEAKYPDIDVFHQGDWIADDVISQLCGTERKHLTTLFGSDETGETLFDLLEFIDNRTAVPLALQDVEKLRIKHHMATSYLPTSYFDNDSMTFNNVKSATEIMIAALYYYAFNEYKLAKCAHCGKWFATKTFKIKYCTRKSPVDRYSDLNCEQAVRNIIQQCRRKKAKIVELTKKTISYELGDNPYLDILDNRCKHFYDDEALKKKKDPSPIATAENLSKYLEFLDKEKEAREWLNY